ncbi:hypothetical protein [Curtobacterium sp. MCJR17_043]|uniref:PstC family ABC transporter permease n=1 Tax=Curtobacterium sp. MCJR17_043 TaxID=2175660 RepID=UPI0024E03C20|nr:hypothetical protein [Curtobacterium sp. MCJR17_043]WIB35562.1 hypothetical protein DEJ15_15415 [Curtobacterium sp. MCJR17_043]
MSTDSPRLLTVVRDPSDVRFRFIARAGGVAVLTIMSLVGLFLAFRASEALRVAGFSFLTTQAWDPDAHRFGIAAVLVGTILIACVAIALAVPLSLGTALYITEYAPTRVRKFFIGLVDLMAAIPSVVYGLWGVLLPAGADHPGVAVDLAVVRVDPAVPRRGDRPGRPARVLDRLHGVDLHRRHRRRADDHPDRHLDHARGLLAGTARRAGGGRSPSGRRSGA